MGPFCRIMDTISLMQQLLPHLQASTQQQHQQQSTASGAATTTSNQHFSSPSSSSSNSGSLPFGFMKISPTTTVIDANCGLPTAAEASPPSHHQSLMSLISKTEAALPPEAASTSSSGACLPSPHCLVQSYMAAVHAAAALQSDAFHSAFRTPFPSSQPSPSSSSSMPPPPPPTTSSAPATTTSDSFLTLALNTLVSSSDDDSKDDSKSSYDGTNRGALLCVVCSDTASGFHYGVFACEGCKGFFRRSIQHKLKYRPCSKFQQCAIVRNNRNRCQDCRLKKCNSVGMSRDAVRFGRVPKREKVKMVEEMQRATLRSLMDSMNVELEDEQIIITSVEWGFQEFGDSLKKEINIGNLQNSCNFNNSNNINEQMQQLLKSFSAVINGGNHNFDGFMQQQSGASSGCPVTKTDSYLSLLKSVVQFSESIRGFQFLYKDDKVKLLKNSIFPALLLRLASIKTSDSEYLFSTQRYGILQDSSFHSMNNNNNGKLNSEMINDFIQRLRSLNFDEKQMALFTALVITQSDSASASGCNMAAGSEPPASQTNLIKLLQEKLWIVLHKTLYSSNAIDLTIKIQSMFSLLTDLKRINEMHEIRLKSFSFIGQPLPSPPVTVSTAPVAPKAVPMSVPLSIANLASSIIPKKEPTETPMIVEAMPTLRKALETSLHHDDSTPTTSTSSSMASPTMTNGTRRSVCDRHPAVASLLSRPPLSTPKSTNSTVIVKAECMDSTSYGNNNEEDIDMKDDIISKSNEVKIKSEFDDGSNNNDDEDDEMPLNLCIRDSKVLS